MLDTRRQVHQRIETNHSLSFVRKFVFIDLGLKDCGAFHDSYGIFLRRNVHANIKTHVIRKRMHLRRYFTGSVSPLTLTATATIYCNLSELMLLFSYCQCSVKGQKVYVTLAMFRKKIARQTARN